MKVKITAQDYNPLLKRKEVVFEAEHELKEGTPARKELRRSLADILKANVDLIFIERAVTKTGSQLTVGEANVYDTAEQVKMVEEDHIITRNVPPPPKPEEGEAPAPAPPAPAAAPSPEAPKQAAPKPETEQKPKEA